VRFQLAFRFTLVTSSPSHSTVIAASGGAFTSKEVIIEGKNSEVAVKVCLWGTATLLQFMLHISPTQLLVWDTAGEELYRAMTKSFFKGASGAIIVYDVTSSKSLSNIPGWVADFRSHNPDGIIVVAGNKADMPPEKHRATEEDADEVMARIRPQIEADGGALLHVRVSALTGEGVQGAFSSLALQLAERYLGLKPLTG
jgi:small GTP-binding protein